MKAIIAGLTTVFLSSVASAAVSHSILKLFVR